MAEREKGDGDSGVKRFFDHECIEPRFFDALRRPSARWFGDGKADQETENEKYAGAEKYPGIIEAAKQREAEHGT